MIFGLIDSGAARTLLPFEIAEQLQIADGLVQDPEPGIGVPQVEFPTWSHPDPIVAQLVTDREFWGDAFLLRPAYVQLAVTPLLGRSDFFRAFDIRFRALNNHGESSVELEQTSRA